MIFVPSKGGCSHVEVDESSSDDCEKGANVLLYVMLKSANDK
jgi:beta-ureidopropionase / N-carbamoyl-L-amino-acid hydrolase